MWALCFQSPPYQGVTVSPPKLYYKMQVLDTSAWSAQAQLLCSSNACLSGCRNHISFSISLVRNAWLCAPYRFGFILFIDSFLLAEATGEGPFSSKTSRHLCVCFACRVCVSGWKQQMQVLLLSPLASGSELFQTTWWRRWLAHLPASHRGWCGGEEGMGFLITPVG